jgi:hypothetical protein
LFEFSEMLLSAVVRYGVPDSFDPDPLVFDGRKVEIGKIFKGEGRQYDYIYDLGDYWRRRVILEKVDAGDIMRAHCLEGAGACPP